LYFEEKLVEGINKKSVQILTVLLEKPKQVVSHEEIIARVWGDNYTGATAQNVAQYIRKLRKALSEIKPSESFIGTAPNRGYIFDREVSVEAPTNHREPPQAASDESNRPDDTTAPPPPKPPRTRSRTAWIAIPLLLVAGVAAYFAAQAYRGTPEEDHVRRVVQESQLYESLVLYKDPKAFTEGDLDKYWTTELDLNSNLDRKKIRTGVKNLLEKGQHYGNETKCEQFEFQSVEIDATNKMALVKTLEKWFIAVYRDDGSLEKNKYVGPYFVSYVLRNVDGRWLIEKSNTARANLPTPRIAAIEPNGEIKPGQQIFVKISGEEFLPQSVYVRVIGEGCPEQSPCIVPNSALLKHSKLTETTIDQLPLTLASGEFQIFVHNSETHVSNPVSLRIP
jgi:DNA-binding winged helix-turn-helix (wHTH) protein